MAICRVIFDVKVILVSQGYLLKITKRFLGQNLTTNSGSGGAMSPSVGRL